MEPLNNPDTRPENADRDQIAELIEAASSTPDRALVLEAAIEHLSDPEDIDWFYEQLVEYVFRNRSEWRPLTLISAHKEAAQIIWSQLKYQTQYQQLTFEQLQPWVKMLNNLDGVNFKMGKFKLVEHILASDYL